GYGLIFAGSGERFRRFRKTCMPVCSQSCGAMQIESARNVIHDVLNDPKRYIQHVQR
ncbi:hypothetical protein J3R82DRAFT_11275, partial [Butyriboletus roseoflavus]